MPVLVAPPGVDALMTSRWQAAIAGTIAAGTALAVTELVTAPGNCGPSLISAVGSRFIDRFGGSLKALTDSW